MDKICFSHYRCISAAFTITQINKCKLVNVNLMLMFITFILSIIKKIPLGNNKDNANPFNLTSRGRMGYLSIANPAPTGIHVELHPEPAQNGNCVMSHIPMRQSHINRASMLV